VPTPLGRLRAAASESLTRLGSILAPRADAPFGPSPMNGPPPNVPPASYGASQPIAPPPGGTPFRLGYHDKTLVPNTPPVNFGGITLAFARTILDQHDAGTSFYFSYQLAVAMTRYPAVYSALGVRCAPAIALPRQIDGGARGLPRIVREEVEAMITPKDGRLSSPYFPSTLWGTIGWDLAMLGFAVLQHVYGAPDARGIRKMYTRRWPPWSVYYEPWRQTYVALIANGPPVDIINDGKFTLIGKTDIPHLQAAIRPLMMPVFDASQVVQARAGWIDKYSDPKWIGYMPEGQGPRTPEGRAFYDAMQEATSPGGVGAFPHGSNVKIEGLSAEASACFKEALDQDNSFVDRVLTGLDTGANGGVYKPLAFWGILHSTVGDDLAAEERGINSAIDHYCDFNYADALPSKDRPALDIPLPDPEADARFDAEAKRYKALTEQMDADRAAGFNVDVDRVAFLGSKLGAVPGVLAEKSSSPKPPIDAAPTDVVKVFRADELRASRGYEPFGDERGKLTIPELDARSAATPVPAEGAPTKTPDPAPTEPPKGEPDTP